MCIKIMSMLWDTRGHFTATEKSILLKIADSASEDGTNAYPGSGSIAKCCELTPRCVFANLESIYKKKILKKRNRVKDGRTTSNTYSFDLKLLRWMVANPVSKSVNKACITQGK